MVIEGHVRVKCVAKVLGESYRYEILTKERYGDVTGRFLAQHSVATLLRPCFEWLQHCSNICNAVLRQKSSLRIVPCNITFKVYRHQQTLD